jgi:hypothetical protein
MLKSATSMPVPLHSDRIIRVYSDDIRFDSFPGLAMAARLDVRWLVRMSVFCSAKGRAGESEQMEIASRKEERVTRLDEKYTRQHIGSVS